MISNAEILRNCDFIKVALFSWEVRYFRDLVMIKWDWLEGNWWRFAFMRGFESCWDRWISLVGAIPHFRILFRKFSDFKNRCFLNSLHMIDFTVWRDNQLMMKLLKPSPIERQRTGWTFHTVTQHTDEICVSYANVNMQPSVRWDLWLLDSNVVAELLRNCG